MTNVQKLQIRQSEIRERLNTLSNPETELTEDHKTELNNLMSEMVEIEPKLRAAITAEQEAMESRNDGTSEDAAFDDLRKRASVSEYIRQAINRQPLDGACRELNDELKIVPVRGQGGGILMPVEQLGLRLRADAANTTTTAADADQTNRRPIFSRLFAKGVLDTLGVRIDSVPVSLIEYPILTGATTPAMTAEDTEAADTVAATWNSEILKPKRLIAQYEFTAEALMTVPGLDAALSEDLQMAINAQMSKEVLGDGDGTGADIRGFQDAIDFSAITNPTSKVTSGTFIANILEVIDGLHASDESEISAVIGPDTYKAIAALMFTGTTENAFDVLRRRGTSIVTSAHVADPVSDIQRGYIHAGRDPARGDSIAAVWPAMEVISDPYSLASSSKTLITSTMLWDAYCGFRSGAYDGEKFKLA